MFSEYWDLKEDFPEKDAHQTVATLMPAGVETNADCMVRALSPLRRLAEQGIAIRFMHPPHKGKGR